MLPTHEQGKTRGKSDSFGTSPAAGPSGGERGGARKGKSQSESVQARQTDKESQASDVLYCVGIGDQFPLRSNEIDRLGGWGSRGGQLGQEHEPEGGFYPCRTVGQSPLDDKGTNGQFPTEIMRCGMGCDPGQGVARKKCGCLSNGKRKGCVIKRQGKLGSIGKRKSEGKGIRQIDLADAAGRLSISHDV